jgi:arylsulfatase A-like enzyme
LYKDTPIPKPVARENELSEKPRQHEALKKVFAGDGHESCINMYLANDERIDHMRRHYYAKVTTVDEKIGEILDALEARGCMDNTLIIFCSDHGENLGDHNLAYKWLMYDSVTHIPLIIRYPDQARQGEQVSELASLMDLGPTILEAAGVPVPTYLEGQSLMSYAQEDGESDPRKYVFCEDNYQIMMRSQTHKMVYYIGQEEGELYDLDADPGELWNRWSDEDYADIKSTLRNDLLEWLAASNYWHAGYKRERASQYTMRWPTEDNCNLQGQPAQNVQPPQL